MVGFCELLIKSKEVQFSLSRLVYDTSTNKAKKKQKCYKLRVEINNYTRCDVTRIDQLQVGSLRHSV